VLVRGGDPPGPPAIRSLGQNPPAAGLASDRRYAVA
jgi:hypothetical protein